MEFTCWWQGAGCGTGNSCKQQHRAAVLLALSSLLFVVGAVSPDCNSVWGGHGYPHL